MHRETLLSLLGRYGRSGRLTDEERPSFDRLVSFVHHRPQCFERTNAEGHLTGSAWVLSHDRQQCLLTHHKKLGMWIQPGGHADGDPDLLGVAAREAREESGIADLAILSPEIFDIDVHTIPANPKEREHLHYDVRFAFCAAEGARLVVSDESHDLAWVGRDEVPRYSDDASVLRMARKWCF